MRVNSDNRVTIPKAIREKLGMFPGTEVEFIINGDSVDLIKKAPKLRGSEMLSRRKVSRKTVVGKSIK